MHTTPSKRLSVKNTFKPTNSSVYSVPEDEDICAVLRRFDQPLALYPYRDERTGTVYLRHVDSLKVPFFRREIVRRARRHFPKMSENLPAIRLMKYAIELFKLESGEPVTQYSNNMESFVIMHGAVASAK